MKRRDLLQHLTRQGCRFVREGFVASLASQNLEKDLVRGLDSPTADSDQHFSGNSYLTPHSCRQRFTASRCR
jgi:hypothetical protein